MKFLKTIISMKKNFAFFAHKLSPTRTNFAAMVFGLTSYNNMILAIKTEIIYCIVLITR